MAGVADPSGTPAAVTVAGRVAAAAPAPVAVPAPASRPATATAAANPVRPLVFPLLMLSLLARRPRAARPVGPAMGSALTRPKIGKPGHDRRRRAGHVPKAR